MFTIGGGTSQMLRNLKHCSATCQEAVISRRMTPQQESRPNGRAGWRRRMDGDCAAYERLLGDCLPFLRSIASRYHRTADRREDAV